MSYATLNAGQNQTNVQVFDSIEDADAFGENTECLFLIDDESAAKIKQHASMNAQVNVLNTDDDEQVYSSWAVCDFEVTGKTVHVTKIDLQEPEYI